MNSISRPIFVVGATGFLGGQVVDVLLARSEDSRAMFKFFQTGRFVADPTAHQQFLALAR